MNYNCYNEPAAVSPNIGIYRDMHGLIFETSISLLAGSTRQSLPRRTHLGHNATRFKNHGRNYSTRKHNQPGCNTQHLLHVPGTGAKQFANPTPKMDFSLCCLNQRPSPRSPLHIQPSQCTVHGQSLRSTTRQGGNRQVRPRTPLTSTITYGFCDLTCFSDKTPQSRRRATEKNKFATAKKTGAAAAAATATATATTAATAATGTAAPVDQPLKRWKQPC